MAYKILAVDDDPTILRLIRNAMQNLPYEVSTRSAVEEINLCDYIGYDLILLDVMMPVSGLDICREIRRFIKVPILFLTAKESENDIVDGIDSGADDYIIKPFRIRELRSRIAMHLRREERCVPQKRMICLDQQQIEIEDRRVRVNGVAVVMTQREFAIFNLFAGNPRRVFSSEEIFECVYPIAANTQIRSVSEYIYQIRKKFRPFALEPIATVWGGGYRWNGQ